jgi:hypothetical protein
MRLSARRGFNPLERLMQSKKKSRTGEAPVRDFQFKELRL